MAGVTRVVGAFEHSVDTCDERSDGIMGVLIAGVVWERELVYCILYMITCGGTCGETGVCHG